MSAQIVAPAGLAELTDGRTLGPCALRPEPESPGPTSRPTGRAGPWLRAPLSSCSHPRVTPHPTTLRPDTWTLTAPLSRASGHTQRSGARREGGTGLAGAPVSSAPRPGTEAQALPGPHWPHPWLGRRLPHPLPAGSRCTPPLPRPSCHLCPPEPAPHARQARSRASSAPGQPLCTAHTCSAGQLPPGMSEGLCVSPAPGAVQRGSQGDLCTFLDPSHTSSVPPPLPAPPGRPEGGRPTVTSHGHSPSLKEPLCARFLASVFCGNERCKHQGSAGSRGRGGLRGPTAPRGRPAQQEWGLPSAQTAFCNCWLPEGCGATEWGPGQVGRPQSRQGR